MNNLTGASMAVFRSVLGGAAGLMGSRDLARNGDLARSTGLAVNAGLPISIQALPRVVEAVAPAAVAVISELLEPCRK
jgi:hypothetical protein